MWAQLAPMTKSPTIASSAITPISKSLRRRSQAIIVRNE
jgi:hypothetical protein